jgi:hypothetical protein
VFSQASGTDGPPLLSNLEGDPAANQLSIIKEVAVAGERLAAIRV